MTTSYNTSPSPSSYVDSPSLLASSSTAYTPSSSTAPPPSHHLNQAPSSAQTSSNTFTFPRTHSFPPFYTLQPNTSTLHAQLTKWSSIILSYCQFHKLVRLSISNALETELFWNKDINRRLGRKEVGEILEYMRKEGRVEFIGGGGKGKGDDVGLVWVWWRTVEEWAGLIENWVEETGQKNTVLTLYELTQSDATIGQDFHGIHPELLQRALSILVKRGKAQIFGQEDQQGVKFF